MKRPSRPIRRLFDLRERRPIVVTIHPDGFVEFREFRRRVVYTAHLSALLSHAVRAFAVAEANERKARRAAKRAAREK